MDHGKADAEALPVAARKNAGAFIHEIGDAGLPGDIFYSPYNIRRADIVAPRGIGQALAHGQRIVKPEKIRKITAYAMRLARLLGDIDAVDGHCAAIRNIKRGKAPQQRRVYGPVRTHQRRDAALRKVKRSIMQYPLARIVEVEVFQRLSCDFLSIY